METKPVVSFIMSEAAAPIVSDATSEVSGASYTSAALSARELEWAKNPPELEAEHSRINGPIVRTRFPPEPNGFLHVGHAKSMNMNFSLAFEKLGVPMEHRRCIFRYDDTNPDAETAEYIDSLKRDLEWLGWTPEKTTYSSDYFQQLYEYAVTLIKKGLAYVCDMTKAEMEQQRALAMLRSNARNTGKDPDVVAPITDPNIFPGRNRNTSVERNLELFDKMKMGCFEEGTYTLRLKMDLESANPNMYDLVAYRIKYTPHPHAGDGWCLYPAYDWTHGTCDSLEHIDYSICTLEFESRREPYYWILWALELFRPKVFEMSRLNLQYTVLSKRRLIKLVDKNYVTGWDDPRMPTVSGLRRRGYTKDILNGFCNEVGATRAENLIEYNKLAQCARVQLAVSSRRCMAALEPIKIVITNFEADEAKPMVSESTNGFTFTVQNIATDESKGSHTVTLTPTFYIDGSDFRMEDSPQYYGLAPEKAVGLKYHGGNLVCDEVIMDGSVIKELKCHLDGTESRPKPKSFISWVPSDSIPAEVRVYDHLFSVAEPSDLWEDELNQDSLIVHKHALVDPSVKEIVDGRVVDRWKSNTALQFERFGYFVVDYDTTYNPETNQGTLIFNRTVSLKEEVFKKKLSSEEEAAIEARRMQARKDVEVKEARMKLDPKDFFREAEEFKGKFKEYDDTGLPTHDIDGQEMTKTMIKKLKKEREKHEKQLAKWSKSKQ